MSLDDINVKLDRAKEHYGTFKSKVDAFAKAKPYPLHTVCQYGNNIDDVVWVRRIPKEWSGYVGDCVHNLRCVLDHIIWDLSGGSERAPDYSEFPIFKDEGEYIQTGKDGNPVRGSGLWKIEGVGRKARAAVYRLQPFQAKDPATHSLWVLHELDRFDKHRALHPVHGWAYTDPARRGITDADKLPFGWRQVGATQSASYPTPGTERKEQVKMRFDLAMHVSFPPQTVAWPDNIDVILTKLIGFVENKVLPEFNLS